jgi:hypothetical protein
MFLFLCPKAQQMLRGGKPCAEKEFKSKID